MVLRGKTSVKYLVVHAHSWQTIPVHARDAVGPFRENLVIRQLSASEPGEQHVHRFPPPSFIPTHHKAVRTEQPHTSPVIPSAKECDQPDNHLPFPKSVPDIANWTKQPINFMKSRVFAYVTFILKNVPIDLNFVFPPWHPYTSLFSSFVPLLRKQKGEEKDHIKSS